MIKPKFHFPRHVTSRYIRRAERIKTSMSSRAIRGVYRNTTPAPKIQLASRYGNINSVDKLRHTRSVAYSVGADLHC